MITLQELKAICVSLKSAMLQPFVDPLNAAMAEFNVDNIEREAMFLAQVAHESGGFYYVEEIASGIAYEGRQDLGNTDPGDGVRFKGRGLIQITGRANYSKCSEALYNYPSKLLSNPELLSQLPDSARSAAWFFESHGCNDLADAGDFVLCTKRINGGLNGYQDRLAYWERAKNTLT
jgi:putative chitinase